MDVKKLKKIDIHAHAIPFPEYAVKWNQGHAWISGEELIEIYDKLNVEKGILPNFSYGLVDFEHLYNNNFQVRHIQHTQTFSLFRIYQ